MVDLGTLGGAFSSAVAISKLGQVIGSSTTTTGQQHAFSWTQEGGMVDLGTLGGTYSTAVAVNDRGQVVGSWGPNRDGAFFRVFSWTQAGGMVDLGTLGGPEARVSGVNNSGWVVGWSLTSTFKGRATLWLPTADSTPPRLTVADVVVNATSAGGAVATYVVTAADDTDPNPIVLCNRPSGSTFPIGTTTVTCTATDASGNQATASFTVRVKGAQEQLQDLRHLVESEKLGAGTSLRDKLVRALALLGQGDVDGTCDTLDAFLNSVRAQAGKSLTSTQAATLTADTLRIESVIDC